ncbi:DUF87 domain-containing protein [Starkeya sp. 3C]|uniref:DUF87 domain-containing protein n=1 Tax=Ancylobacter moscoviensis TaxID=2597768 RepID=A0ABY3DRE2_9HYPH|nr:DNA translocase FtsK [Ancylobacter moscoviensis]TSJ62168.1 DUF87 domain-containing protein [Ancylobacter moscoviensis]
MRNPAHPSDPKADKASENTGAPARPTHVFSRANPQVTYAPRVTQAEKAPHAAPKGMPRGVKPAPASAPREVVPSWLQPFTMPPNTRFTRTPDYLLRQPPAPEPAPALPEPPATAAAVLPPRPSQTPVLRVPPRKPPLGAVPKALIAAHARRALADQPTPDAVPPAMPEAAPQVAEVAPEAPVFAAQPIPVQPMSLQALPITPLPTEAPSSIRQIAGMIQLGWDTPPVTPAPQDMVPQDRPPEHVAADAGLDEDEAVAADAYADELYGYGDEDAGYEDGRYEDVAFDPAAYEDDAFEDETFRMDAANDADEPLLVEEIPDTASAMPEAAAPEAGPTSFGGYSVTPSDVSFSWPMFGMVPAAPVPAAPVATAPVVAAPVVSAPVMAAPVSAEPSPARAPVAPMAAPRPAAPVIPARPAPQPAFAEAADYELPPLDLLTEPPTNEPDYELSEEFLERNSVKLQQVLHDFGVRGEIIDANPGPVVTLYELEPAPGIKSSRVIGLSADISRSMSALSARVAVVEGRNVIGIELPNQRRETVWLREMLSSHEFEAAKAKLGIGLGKTIGGEPVIVDLAKMPHLLVAGTTGSGKSVAINTMILSLLYRHRPEQCRLIMIDPKMLELSVYEGIPHLLTPVVTDPKKAIVALKWAVREMEDRYRKMSRLGVRNIDGFNARVAEAAAKGEIITRTVQKGFDKETGEMLEEEEIMDLAPLPYIVIVVDEMADLMMVAGKDIEGAIQRLAQMARAAGIHLIMATQRPSVDVITGTIKANFPTRISFQVTSKIDSRTILGEMGAEQLLGQGDMLYMAGGGRISRVHGPFVSDREVERVVEHLKAQARPEYLDEVTAEEDEEPVAEESAVFDRTAMGEEAGDLYDQAVAVVMRDRKASTSYIQRRLQIGYNRAASLMERMENEGIVGPANHAGKREILKDSR